MADILINGTLSPNGAYALARSDDITNESTVSGTTISDALDNLSGGSTDITAHTVHITVDDPANAINQSDEVFSAYSYAGSDWQSFTPSISGRLTDFSFWVNLGGTSVVYIDVYEGEGISGELLSDGVINLPADSGWMKMSVINQPYVIAGQKYTVLYTKISGADPALGEDIYGSYAGGRMGSNAAYDLMFRAYITGSPELTMPSATSNPQDLTIVDITDTIYPATNIASLANYNKLATAEGTRTYVDASVLSSIQLVQLILLDAGASTWYLLGYAGSTIQAGVNFNVFVHDKTTAEQSNITFTFSTDGSSVSSARYQIKNGAISGIRPVFRTYYDSGTERSYVYVQIRSGTIASINYDATTDYNWVSIVTYLGTGADPSTVVGTKVYDTVVDDAGYYAPKTVALTANFWTGGKNCVVNFSINGNLCTMYAQYVNVNSSNTADGSIYFPAGTIPTKWLPIAGAQPVAVIRVTENAIPVFGNVWINSAGNGGAQVVAGANSEFNPSGADAMGFNSWSTSWVIANT